MTKRNPFLSLWLSGANRIAGTGRGLWQAEARRQQTAAVRTAASLGVSIWQETLNAWFAPPATKGSQGKTGRRKGDR